MYHLKRNGNGGLYSDGVGFDESKWAEILQCLYAQEIRQNGSCTIKALARRQKEARKAIKAYHDSELNPWSVGMYLKKKLIGIQTIFEQCTMR